MQIVAAVRNYLTITPSMYDMLHKAYQDHKGVTREEIFKIPRASKTLTALVDKKLLELSRDYKTFYVTPRGYALLRMEPRWSGKKQDKYGDTVGNWVVNDLGDHFEPLSPNADMGTEINKATPFIEMEDRHVVTSRIRRSNLMCKRASLRFAKKMFGV